MPELVRFADSRDWTLQAGVDLAANAELAPALHAAEQRLRALNDVEVMRRDEGGNWTGKSKEVRDWLKPFGMMIAPGLTPKAKTDWLNALLVSLSDLPPDAVVLAAQQAMHKPMTFLNEVHGAIRTIAEQHVMSRRLSLTRLRELQAEIRRAGDRSRQLPSPPDELTADDIRRMSPAIRALGITAGALTQQQIDDALAEDAPEQSRAA